MHWVIEKLDWLISLAKPENLEQAVNLGGPRYVGYLLLAAIIFSETGLLVGFFLPGDSLLFTAGFLAGSKGIFQIDTLILVLSAAAVLGDGVNYFFGLQLESHVLEKGKLRFVKHEHLIAAKEFYERWGPIAIVYARFAPLVRTFTPFVAGVGRMGYRRFALYNIIGGVGWVVLMTMAGYLLGGVEFVSKHFEPIVLGIVAVSLLPVVLIVFRGWQKRRAAKGRSGLRPDEGAA